MNSCTAVAACGGLDGIGTIIMGLLRGSAQKGKEMEVVAVGFDKLFFGSRGCCLNGHSGGFKAVTSYCTSIGNVKMKYIT